MNNNLNGNIAEANAILYFTEQGYDVFIPTTINPKVDVVVIKDGEVSRVQVKSTCSDDVNLRSSYSNTNKTIRKPFNGNDFELLFVWQSTSNSCKVVNSKSIKNIRSIRYSSL